MADNREELLKIARQDFDDAAIEQANERKAMTPEELKKRFEEYRVRVKDNPFEVNCFVGKEGTEAHFKKEKCLTMEGFENYLEDVYGLGAIQQYLENRDKRYNDYVPIVQRIKRVIREDQITGGMAGVYHHNLTARLNGISDKMETPGDNVKVMNFDAI